MTDAAPMIPKSPTNDDNGDLFRTVDDASELSDEGMALLEAESAKELARLQKLGLSIEQIAALNKANVEDIAALNRATKTMNYLIRPPEPYNPNDPDDIPF